MSIDVNALTKKDKDELIDLIKNQDTRIKDLEKKVSRKGGLGGTDTDSSSGTINAFDYTNLKNLQEGFESTIRSVKNMGNLLDTATFKELDERATDIQRNFGLAKDRLFEFKTVLGESVPELVKMGYTQEQAFQVLADAQDGLKTAASLNSDVIRELGATAAVTGEEVETLAGEFRGVGVSVGEVAEQMKSVVDYARSVGVSVKSVSKAVLQDLEKLNLYNFDNGVVGLAKMASMSDRFNISMADTFRIADELFSPEKAIEYAASLQRLGVTTNGLLDPLRAMDMAQNSPEELMKSIVDLGKEFASFNEQTGQMEILPGGKRRLREIAGELKIDAAEFAKMSLQAADFDRKISQIRMPAIAEGNEETKELIASMAQLDKSGIATIQVRNVETGGITEKKVEELTAEDIRNLQRANEESSMTMEQLAVSQLDETRQITSILESGELAAKYGRATAPTMERLGQSIAGGYKSIARAQREALGDTKSIRAGFESVGKPTEDLLRATFFGTPDEITKAVSDLTTSSAEIFKNFFDSGTEFVQTAKEGIVKSFEKQYNNQSTNQTQTLNLNVKVEGDANTSKMDKKEITNALVQVIQDPNTANAMNSGLNGGTAPSAMTGGKNKPN